MVGGVASEDNGTKKKLARSAEMKKNKKLDPVGSTVRYEMLKLCTGSV